MTVRLEYFVDGLHSQMTKIQAKGERLIKQGSRLQKIEKVGFNKRQEKAVKRLTIKETLSVNEYQVAASCIRRTAQRDSEDLTEKKVVKVVARSPTDPTKHYVANIRTSLTLFRLLQKVTVPCIKTSLTVFL